MKQMLKSAAFESRPTFFDNAGYEPQKFRSPQEAIATLNPEGPICAIYPGRISDCTREFVNGFVGKTLYAVKANPHPVALAAVWNGGVRNFDVASGAEIDLVRTLFPTARLFFMHPVKSASAIRYATSCGVRDFAFDDEGELVKILAETAGHNLHLHLRVKAVSGHALYDLSGKFGALADESVKLLRQAHLSGAKIGITFHVGSQCMDPSAYTSMIAYARQLEKMAGVTLDSIDVGGGFPVEYPGMVPPSIAAYLTAINRALRAGKQGDVEFLAEPGRRLVATGGSTLVRIDKRKGHLLYINDGVYGSLFDAGPAKWRFPARPVVARPFDQSTSDTGFSFYGPTCDDLDFMAGPFMLPDSVEEGDWIEISNLGAYGQALSGKFNGFGADTTVVVQDPPNN